MNFDILIAIGALALSMVTIFVRLFDKSLSIREHDEFRKGVERNTDGLQDQLRREIDKIEMRINVIEATRPTAGELKSTAEGLAKGLDEIKAKMK